MSDTALERAAQAAANTDWNDPNTGTGGEPAPTGQEPAPEGGTKLAPPPPEGGKGSMGFSDTPVSPDANMVPTPAPPTPQPAPVQNEPAPENPQTGSFIEKFLTEHNPEALENLKNNPNFGSINKAMDALGKKAREKVETPLPHEQDLLNKRIAEMEAEIKELTPYRSAQEVQKSEAFQEEFLKPKADSLENVVRLAREGGVSEEVAKQALNQGSEVAAVRYLQENVDDDVTRRLLESEVREFVRLDSKEKKAISELKNDPVAKVEEYQERSRTVRGRQAQRMMQDSQSDFLDSTNRVYATLADAQGGDPLLKGEYGQAIKGRMEAMFSNGQALTTDQMTEAIMRAETSEVYKTAYLSSQQEIDRLTQELSRFTGSQPSYSPTHQGGAPAPARAPQYDPTRTAQPKPMKFSSSMMG